MAYFFFSHRNKKSVAGLLLCVVLCVALLAPFEVSFAQNNKSEGGTGGIGNGILAEFLGIDKLGTLIDNALADVGNTIMGTFGLAVTGAGILFNWAVDNAIHNRFLNNNDFVGVGWRTLRDVVNLFFIFILLYIAIATILQVEGFNTKKLLTNIIVVALLVNFSLVITRAIVDVSNVVALEFYNSITVTGTAVGTPKNIGAIFVEGLRIESVWDVTNPSTLGSNVEASLSSIILITSLGSVLLLVVAFVLLAAAILFVIRSVVLMILMVLAPLGFLAMILPQTQKYAHQWWHALFSQAFFAPFYMILFAAYATMIQNVDNNALLAKAKTESWADTLTNWTQQSALILNFAVLIGLAIGILVVAKMVGAAGASTTIAWGQSARRWGQGKVAGGVGRVWHATGGRAASAAAGSTIMQGLATKSPRIGSLMYRGLDKTAQGYQQSVQTKTDSQIALGKRISAGAGGAQRLQTYQTTLAATGGIAAGKAGEALTEYREKLRSDQERVGRLKTEREGVNKNVNEIRQLVAETKDIRPEEQNAMNKELSRLDHELDRIDKEIERRSKNIGQTQNWQEVKTQKKTDTKDNKTA